jgi:hypothetical protein
MHIGEGFALSGCTGAVIGHTFRQNVAIGYLNAVKRLTQRKILTTCVSECSGSGIPRKERALFKNMPSFLVVHKVFDY